MTIFCESDSKGQVGEACDDPNLQTAQLAKLKALKRDVAAGVRSIIAGHVSRATPEDIKLESLRRRATR